MRQTYTLVPYHTRYGHIQLSSTIHNTLLLTNKTNPLRRIWERLIPRTREAGTHVKALVRWATGERLTNRLPKLSLITLSPPLNSGILGLRMGPYVPTPKFFYNLWGPRESD